MEGLEKKGFDFNDHRGLMQRVSRALQEAYHAGIFQQREGLAEESYYQRSLLGLISKE